MDKHGKVYRVRKQIDGKKYTLTFEHQPTQKEIRQALEDIAKNNACPIVETFDVCAQEYIKAKSAILSPSTIKAYDSYRRNMPVWFSTLPIGKIDALQVQKVINEYAEKKTPKYTRNVHGFISAVLGMFNPSLIINTTLPQKRPNDDYKPTDDDIKRILAEAKDTMFEVPLWLACFGVRRSEQICLTESDLDGNILTINKSMVQDKNKQWVTKITKTSASVRKIPLTDNVVNLIHEKGFYNGHPNSITCWLYKTEKRLGIPRFPLHDFRHYFAAKMSTLTDEATVLKIGGWNSPYVMKSVYRYAMQESVNEAEKDMQKMIDKLK